MIILLEKHLAIYTHDNISYQNRNKKAFLHFDKIEGYKKPSANIVSKNS